MFNFAKKATVNKIHKYEKSATTTQQYQAKLLTVNDLLNAFSDWDKTGFTKSPIMLVIKNKATLTIMEENEYVKWAEVVVIAPNMKPESIADNKLTPIIKLLSAILPDWKDGESWVRNNLSNLPASNTKDKWQLRLTYSSNTGLSLLASQLLPITSVSDTTSKSSSTSSTTLNLRVDPYFADDFEKLVVANGRPLVFAASVEGDKGPAKSKYDSKFLGVWVTRDWDFLTDIDKRSFVKLHLTIFNQWRGKDDGIVIIFDSSDTEIASGNKYSISLKK